MLASGAIFSGFLFVIHAPIKLVFYTLSILATYLLVFLVFKNNHLKAGFYGILYLTIVNALIANTLVGWQSGLNLLLMLMIPAIFYNPVINRKGKVLVYMSYAAAIAFTVILGFWVTPVISLSRLHIQILNSLNLMITCLALAGILFLDFRKSTSISAQLLELNRQLSILASRDSLTNLLNRRTMVQYIEIEHARSDRSGKSFGLIMADVDDFKRVNDQFGHAAGDSILGELSYLLSTTLRKQDLISRWGGEEFLILLPETDFEGVQVAAEKIRSLISQSSILFQGKSIRITVSIGGVVCEGREDWEECLKQADRALYFGKKNGKNIATFVKGELYCVLGCYDSEEE